MILQTRFKSLVPLPVHSSLIIPNGLFDPYTSIGTQPVIFV